GWAIDMKDGAPVTQVQVLIDGTVVGNATLGLARPDIAAGYGNARFLNAGWTFSYSAQNLSAGSHTVSAVAYDSLGLSTTLGNSRTVQVANVAPVGYIDSAGDSITQATTISPSG